MARDFEVIGWVIEGEYGCALHCDPTQAEQDDGYASPVFAGDESADEYHCAQCYADAHPAPKYLDLARITGYRLTGEPRSRRRQDGYGTLVPGPVQIQIDGKRWHRVRTTCWSNSGTDFVQVAGEQLILATGWHDAAAFRQSQSECIAGYKAHLADLAAATRNS